jgi:hypothetical protein
VIFFLQVHGFDVRQVVVDRYKAPTTPPIYKYGNKLFENNSKATNAILRPFFYSLYVKVMHCDSVKEMWEKL